MGRMADQERMDNGATIMSLADVYRAEILAARLEGALRADAELAMLWRAEAAVQEACASAWLEDLPVRPETLLVRDFRAEVGDPDQDRAALSAAGILRGLHSPGDLLHMTEEVMSRIWALSMREVTGDAPFTTADCARIQTALRDAESPILGAIAVAQLVSEFTEGQAPSVERLAFVAADHSLRGSGRFMLGEVEAPRHLIAAPRGNWVVQPSVALVDNGFRLWSVMRPERVADLVAGLTHSLERAVGSLALHRRFLDRARKLEASAHGSSKTPELMRLLMVQPIVSSGEVAARLDISPRGALKLIDRAVEDGVLVKVVGRNTYRAWATVPFARVLGRR
jgi:hypothetical protein